MLQKIGDSLKGKKALAYLILIPLALVFAAWGAVGVVDMDFFNPKAFAVEVNGKKVPLERATDAWREQQSRFQQQFGLEVPEATKPVMQDSLLEQFVREALVTQRTEDRGYRVSTSRVDQTIEREPAFQVDGKYSETLALARLSQIGRTPEQFKAEIRTDLRNGELQRGIQLSEFRTPREISRMLALEDEQREVRYAALPLERFESAVVADDAAINAFYARNIAQYQTAETVRLDYAELRLESIAAQVTVAETDLQDLYAKNRDRYADAEKRRARHILIAVKGGNDAAAKAQADAVLAEARAGKDFSELAKKFSQDSGSASQGGDLGWSERSVFVGPFADAVFSMKEGDLRGPVKTDFGYHVIRLDGIQAARNKTYEEARPELDAQFRRDRAADLFGDRQEQVQRRMEQPGADLATLAKEFGLTSGEVVEFARGTGGAPLGASRELDELVFGDAVLNQRRLGGPVALGEDRFVIVKVRDHRKPGPKPLATIRDEVASALRRELGSVAARKSADEALRRLDAGESFEAVARSLGATVEAARFVGRGDPAMPAQIRELAFTLPRPPAGKPINRAVTLDQGGAALVSLTQTRAAPPDDNVELRSQRVNEAMARSGLGDLSAYVNEMRRRAEVVKNPKAFE